MALIEFKCPHCDNQFRVPEDMAGRDGWCRVCKRLVIVPNTDGSGVQWDELSPEERCERLDRVLQFAATKADRLKNLLTRYADGEGKLAPVNNVRGRENATVTPSPEGTSDTLAAVRRERDAIAADRDALAKQCEELRGHLTKQSESDSDGETDLYLEKLMLTASVEAAEDRLRALREQVRDQQQRIAALEAERADFSRRLAETDAALQSAQAEQQEAEQALEAEQASRSALEAELESEQASRSALEGRLETAQSEVTELRTRCESLEAQVSEWQGTAEAADANAQQAERISADYEAVQQARQAAEAARDAESERRAALETELAEARSALRERQATLDAQQDAAAKAEARAAELAAALKTAEAGQQQEQDARQAAESRAEAAQTELETLRARLASPESESSGNAADDVAELQRSLSEARAARAAVELERRAAEGRLRQARDEHATAQATIERLQEQIAALQPNADALEEAHQREAALQQRLDELTEALEAARQQAPAASDAGDGPEESSNWVFSGLPVSESPPDADSDGADGGSAQPPARWVEPEPVREDATEEEDAIVHSYLKFLGRS